MLLIRYTTPESDVAIVNTSRRLALAKACERESVLTRQMIRTLFESLLEQVPKRDAFVDYDPTTLPTTDRRTWMIDDGMVRIAPTIFESKRRIHIPRGAPDYAILKALYKSLMEAKPLEIREFYRGMLADVLNAPSPNGKDLPPPPTS